MFILGILIIQFSASLGYATLNFVYINKNLAEEYSLLLNGYIYSYMLIGFLIFTIGIFDWILEKIKASHTWETFILALLDLNVEICIAS